MSSSIVDMVRARTLGSVQTPLYSIFREECTRDECAAMNFTQLKAQPREFRRLCETSDQLLCFPGSNAHSLKNVEAPCVALIGDSLAITKFIAEEYWRRGACVTVLTKKIDEAAALLTPIADGSRDERQSYSRGLITLRPSTNSSIERTVDEVDASTHRRVLRFEHVLTNAGAPKVAEETHSVPGHDLRAPPTRVFELVEGDCSSMVDVERTVHRAAVVYYLGNDVPRGGDSWMARRYHRWTKSNEMVKGFSHVVETCKRVDSHLIVLNPLWVHQGSSLSPLYWFRRAAHPFHFSRAIKNLEAQLISTYGVPSHSNVRFSIFRVGDVVYPSFSDSLLVAKNNRLDDPLLMTSVPCGDMDSRMFAQVLAKCIALCPSVVGSRLDLAGCRAASPDRSGRSMVKAFHELRSE